MKRPVHPSAYRLLFMKHIARKILGLTAVLAFGVQAQANDIRSGLLSYYSFETSLTEDSANDNDWTEVNSPTLVTTNAGPRGSAVQFNGSNQYLRLEHAFDNAATGFPIYRAGSYTVAMWVKGAPQQGKSVFSEGSSTANNPLLALQTGPAGLTSKFSVLVRTDGGGALVNNVVSSNVVFDSTWHHVAWVEDNGSAKLYVDGNLDGANYSYTRGGTLSMDRTHLGSLVRSTPLNYFNGSVDDLAIWERALTQSEVQQVMANGVSTPVPVLPPIITSQPVSVTKNFQDAVTLAVTAVGTRPNHILSYQWYKNESPILDATNRTHRIFNLTTNNSGEVFKVTVTGDSGSLTSSNATLTVLPDGPADVRLQLESYWPLDAVTNNSGAVTSIDIYSRNDLSLTNMNEGNLIVGQFSNALSFAGSHAVRSGGTTIYNNNGYSVAMWVRANGTIQSDVRVYSEASTNSDAPLFTIGTAIPANPSGLAKILIRNDANRTLLDRLSTRPIFDGNWHHIVWTDSNGLGKLYVDGVLDETDFTYTPSVSTLNVSSVGAVVRKAAGNMVTGDIDEIATWRRPISYTEIQEIMASSIPEPLAPTPPTFVSHPSSTNVFTRADVSLSVLVTGTGPFSYQWFKGASLLTGATNAVLALTNIQLADAGTYLVTVENSAGSTNSNPAIVNVTTRPEAPSVLAIDFNERNEASGNTESDFESFTLGGIGAISSATSHLFGGVEVTVSGSNLTTVDSRRRTTPINSGDFTQSLLLRDFIYSTPTAGVNGLDVTIKYMKPDQLYTVTIWSFDTSNTGNRISDWYGNGLLLKDDYVFNGSVLPIDNQQYQFSFNVTSDANGTIKLEGRRDASSPTGPSVFLNALKVAIPSTRITNVILVDGKVRFTIETPDSAAAHTAQETSSLNSVSWTDVVGATPTILSPTSLQIEFPEPTGQTRFYRIQRTE